MPQVIERIVPNLDFTTLIIALSLLLQLSTKLAFPIEFSKFIKNERDTSSNSFWIYSFNSLAFILLVGLVIYKDIDKHYTIVQSSDTFIYITCVVLIFIFLVFKWLLKGIWNLTYNNMDALVEDLSENSYFSYLKYVALLLFLITFTYTPLSQYYTAQYGFYFILLLYIFNWIFDIFKNYFQNNSFNIDKILYLCSLEILPILIFVKLIFLI